jgi:hypothetical protein
MRWVGRNGSALRQDPPFSCDVYAKLHAATAQSSTIGTCAMAVRGSGRLYRQAANGGGGLVRWSVKWGCGWRRRATTTRVRHCSCARTPRRRHSGFRCHPPCVAHSESRESAVRMSAVPDVAASPDHPSRVSHPTFRVPSCATPRSAGALRPRTCSKCDFKSLCCKHLSHDLRASSGHIGSRTTHCGRRKCVWAILQAMRARWLAVQTRRQVRQRRALREALA